jgi:hypothetical protein
MGLPLHTSTCHPSLSRFSGLVLPLQLNFPFLRYPFSNLQFHNFVLSSSPLPFPFVSAPYLQTVAIPQYDSSIPHNKCHSTPSTSSWAIFRDNDGMNLSNWSYERVDMTFQVGSSSLSTLPPSSDRHSISARSTTAFDGNQSQRPQQHLHQQPTREVTEEAYRSQESDDEFTFQSPQLEAKFALASSTLSAPFETHEDLEHPLCSSHPNNELSAFYLERAGKGELGFDVDCWESQLESPLRLGDRCGFVVALKSASVSPYLPSSPQVPVPFEEPWILFAVDMKDDSGDVATF